MVGSAGPCNFSQRARGYPGVTQQVKVRLGTLMAFLICPQIEDETQVSRATQGEQDNYEMHVRAANIVSVGWKTPWRGCR